MSPMKQRSGNRPCFQPGDEVVVRSLDEILGTLDAQGKLDGLPFMPEMNSFCGRRLRVLRRVQRVFIDTHYYVARIQGVVFLEESRCDGAAHGGCQMRCNFFWKDAWLRPASATQPQPPPVAGDPPLDLGRLPTTAGDRYVCQATELAGASRRLQWWKPKGYLRALLTRELTGAQLLGVLRFSARRRAVARQAAQRTAPPPAAAELGLEPGEWVEVRSWPEIAATLDGQGRHRGLLFTPEMSRYCGKRFRVARRMERMVVEWTGQLRNVRNTVALEGAVCHGIVGGMCPRRCSHLWREAWLKRVPPAA